MIITDGSNLATIVLMGIISHSLENPAVLSKLKEEARDAFTSKAETIANAVKGFPYLDVVPQGDILLGSAMR